MKTNNIDNSIKEKLANRTFTPSASAWERLSVQLDEQPKKKKRGWFFYSSIAASILLLISVGIYFFTKNNKTELPKEEFVIVPVDKQNIDKKIDQLINEIPEKEALVENKKINKNKNLEKLTVKVNNHQLNKKHKNNNYNQQISIAEKVDAVSNVKINNRKKNNIVDTIKILKQDPNSTIKVNADDLLYAVTHSPKEVKEYYTKYNVNREDVLRTIHNELKKSNLKVNPNTILAEVERTIKDDDFQNNFMKTLKRKVSDIATVIASRND